MPQTTETGRRANEFGRKTARKIAHEIGARSTSKTSNEFEYKGKHITIRCARYKTNDFGVTYKMLERIDSIIGACEQKNSGYKLYEISPEKFKENMRISRSNDKVRLVRKSVFLTEGKYFRDIRG